MLSRSVFLAMRVYLSSREKPFFQTYNFILQIMLKSAGANISMQSAKQPAH